MKLWSNQNLVFFHAPKTAGTSVTDLLDQSLGYILNSPDLEKGYMQHKDVRASYNLVKNFDPETNKYYFEAIDKTKPIKIPFKNETITIPGNKKIHLGYVIAQDLESYLMAYPQFAKNMTIQELPPKTEKIVAQNN